MLNTNNGSALTGAEPEQGDKKMPKLKYSKIRILRATIAGGEHVRPERTVKDDKGKDVKKEADILTIGKGVTEQEARYLVETGRAEPAGKVTGEAGGSGRESRG